MPQADEGPPPGEPGQRSLRTRRMPSGSVLYDLVIPVLFILFAGLLILIVAVSLGVLTGVIQYR